MRRVTCLLVLLVSCTDSDDVDQCVNADTAVVSGSEYLYGSSCVEGHSHDVKIRMSALDFPDDLLGFTTPAGAEDHKHSIDVTAAQVTAIKSGQSVTITTGIALRTGSSPGHTHQFVLRKP